MLVPVSYGIHRFFIYDCVYIYMSQSGKGRPSNEKPAAYEHEERNKKPENTK